MIRIDDCLVVPSKAPAFGLVSKCVTFWFLPWIGIVVHRKKDGMKRLEGGSWK